MKQAITRRRFLGILGTGAAAGVMPQRESAAEEAMERERPNILFLFADDQRFNTIRALGNEVISTPNLDSLVKDGLTFTHTFSPIPICTPSRAELVTGCSGFRSGVRFFGEKMDPVLPTWPGTMKDKGYLTWYTGKWHNDGTPTTRGFDRARRVFRGGMGNHIMTFEEDGQKVTGFSSELFANAAIDFLKSEPPTPFFMFVSFTAPHDPRMPPERYKAMYDPKKIPLPPNFVPEHPFDNGELRVRDEQLLPWPRTPEAVRGEIAAYYGMISHLDEQIGRILAALRQSGRDKDTIVIFAADNGLAVGCHGLLGKQSMYEHSVRVPLVFSGPGIPKGVRSGALCTLGDVYPTVCELTGIQIPQQVDGKSVVPIIAGKARGVREAVFCSYRDVQRMVRTEKWKLIRYPKIGKNQLFDISSDPHELKDLSADPAYADLLTELVARLTEWQKSVGDEVAGE